MIDANTAIPKLWISGGLDRIKYRISVTVVTSYGRTKEVNFQVKIKDT